MDVDSSTAHPDLCFGLYRFFSKFPEWEPTPVRGVEGPLLTGDRIGRIEGAVNVRGRYLGVGSISGPAGETTFPQCSTRMCVIMGKQTGGRARRRDEKEAYAGACGTQLVVRHKVNVVQWNTDSTVVMYSAQNGRSRNTNINASIGNIIECKIWIGIKWVPSEANLADAPSRAIQTTFPRLLNSLQHNNLISGKNASGGGVARINPQKNNRE
jgi:hypothetical protein